MTLTPEPPEAQFFVLVWREQSSSRLRTYVDDDSRPISVRESEIFPTASQTLTSEPDFQTWLATQVIDETVAVSEDVVRSELGWNPHRASDTEDA